MRTSAALIVWLLVAPFAHAKTPVFEIEIRDHLFQPSELRIPAGTKVKLIVYNRDPTPEEFESYELNRGKVIVGHRNTGLFVGPLSPWKLPLFWRVPKTRRG